VSNCREIGNDVLAAGPRWIIYSERQFTLELKAAFNNSLAVKPEAPQLSPLISAVYYQK
jgi:hypothetical protein